VDSTKKQQACPTTVGATGAPMDDRPAPGLSFASFMNCSSTLFFFYIPRKT
jgi:hypothetical protein